MIFQEGRDPALLPPLIPSVSVYIGGHRLQFSNTNCYSFFEDRSYGILVGSSLSIYRLQAEGTSKAIPFGPSYDKKAPMLSCSRKRKTCIDIVVLIG